jgi:hypothetical protein
VLRVLKNGAGNCNGRANTEREKLAYYTRQQQLEERPTKGADPAGFMNATIHYH